MKKSINHIYLIILLSVLSSVAPMGVDTYLPSIPDIAKSFNVSIHKIELSLSIFLIGFSIGQVFGGPISDKYGRKKSSIFGLLGYALFSFIIIFSTSIYELWAYRFFEAFFGGIVVVNATAAVRDRFHGTEAAKVFSLIGMVRSFAPLLAPIFLISFTFGVGGSILAESGLSFLGLGINPPSMSWGSLLSDGKAVIDIAWWVSFFPGLMIFLITFCLIQISDYLQGLANKKEIIQN